MASINKALIMGRLGQDPELRYTQNQNAVVTLSVATSEFRAAKDGQSRQEETEWHRVVVWGKQAENCHKYLKKGRSVFIEGRIQTRAWDDKNGQKQYSREIVALNVQFMPTASAGTNAYGQTDGSQYGQPQAPGSEFGQPTGSDPFAPPASQAFTPGSTFASQPSAPQTADFQQPGGAQFTSPVYTATPATSPESDPLTSLPPADPSALPTGPATAPSLDDIPF